MERAPVAPLALPATSPNELSPSPSSSASASFHSNHKGTVVKVIPSPAKPVSPVVETTTATAATDSPRDLRASEPLGESDMAESQPDQSEQLEVRPKAPPTTDHIYRVMFQTSLDEDAGIGMETTLLLPQSVESKLGNIRTESEEFNLTFQGSFDGYDSDVEDSDSDELAIPLPDSKEQKSKRLLNVSNTSEWGNEPASDKGESGVFLSKDALLNGNGPSTEYVTSAATIDIN